MTKTIREKLEEMKEKIDGFENTSQFFAKESKNMTIDQLIPIVEQHMQEYKVKVIDKYINDKND